ncbi:ADP-ribosylhydrolase like 2 [Paragonimus heterotremus]|uniref:ADP-ribosylhydrolase ARH3 n=1 Tax=Paragonimus heterotremus TaxID=100268 RepID=A0A8J4WE11_9TREM|nr:ADP-ribosylhydrolase like 2 [Paragonimus heterotremus]
MNIRNFCRGTIFGGLIGDCYGYVYEDRPTVTADIPIKLLNDTQAGVIKSELIYTDDTQMGIATLRSLRANGKLVPTHLAKEYAEDYFKDGTHRYYGGSVPKIFDALKKQNYESPYRFAAEMFNGTGSFGNGGAMRASPVAVYALTLSDKDFEELIVDVTRLTHTHPLAVCGALLQAFAVRQLWTIVSKSNQSPLIPDKFVDNLVQRLSQVTCPFVDWKQSSWCQALSTYKDRMQTVKALLTRPTEPTVADVVKLLGNNLQAINSVPTALYVFLRSLKPISEIPLTSVPLRCLVYAISLGGDTDTIATMACSLAGGYTGLSPEQTGPESPIPQVILARCERLSMIEEMVVWLERHLSTSD